LLTIDKDHGRGHDLYLWFFEKVRSFTPFDQRSGIRLVSGIRPTCQCRCPPLVAIPPHSLAGSVTIYAKTITRVLFSRFLHDGRQLFHIFFFTDTSKERVHYLCSITRQQFKLSAHIQEVLVLLNSGRPLKKLYHFRLSIQPKGIQRS
jgi:hypothetical protein